VRPVYAWSGDETGRAGVSLAYMSLVHLELPSS
jgi:hypothetical protein